MTRLLIALTALLTVLVLGESALRNNQRQAREKQSEMRLLAPVPIADITQIDIRAAGRAWRYILQDSIWYFPAYHRAFALDSRIEHVLKSLTQAPATFVSAEPGDLPRYGLGPNSVRFALLDANGRLLLEVLQGRGAPDIRSSESYVQRAGADTVFHLQAHPVHALEANDPPMLDRRMLPQALPRKNLQKITFAGDPAYPLKSLHRELQEIEIPTPGMPPQGPTYNWIATYPDGERVCLAPSVYAYTDFIKRLTWTALHEPSQTEAFAEARLLYLKDEEGTIDTLAVGGADDQGQYLRLHTTGHVLTVTPAKASLLFPTTTALMDTLPQPTPYKQAEPFSPF